MSTTETRMPLAEARALAEEVVALLSPGCHRIEVAGSIRRQKPDIGDLEVVAVARIALSMGGLFADVPEYESALDDLVARFIGTNTMAPRLDKNKRAALGPSYKRLLFGDTALDLFIATPEKFGCVYLIRTGGAEYVHNLVTSTYEGGRCPGNMKFKDGRLWRFDGDEGEILYGPDEPAGKWHVLDTPNEGDVFREMGVPFIAPEDRK